MSAIREAVILMAGSGSRLRRSPETLPKPLTPILGRPLISYTLNALAGAGITKINIVVGYESDRLTAAVAELAPSNVTLSFVLNPEWQKQNGISLLAAAKNIKSNFPFDDERPPFRQCDCRSTDGIGGGPAFSISRRPEKINSIFDLDDAMKVQTQGGRVVAIGKELPNYDAIDTGLFVCPIEIFNISRARKRKQDCSLADSVRLMATDGKVRAIDIGDAWWQDIDTVEMLQHAEKPHGRRIKKRSVWPSKMPDECVIVADGPAALVELCGISTLERLLRTLQRCGITRAIILSSSAAEIAQRLAQPSWRGPIWNSLFTNGPPVRQQWQQMVDLWPEAAARLLLIQGDVVFDIRLLRALLAQTSSAMLIDSSAPETNRGKLCGAALLQREWAAARKRFRRACASSRASNSTQSKR